MDDEQFKFDNEPTGLAAAARHGQRKGMGVYKRRRETPLVDGRHIAPPPELEQIRELLRKRQENANQSTRSIRSSNLQSK